MPEGRRRWYRSLYWRIAIGYIAVLALLMLAQTSLAVWMTGRVWGRASRTPAQLADLVALDLEKQLEQNAAVDLNEYLPQKYGRGYQPFVVVLRGSDDTFSNRQTMIPPNLPRDARRVLFGAQNPEFDRERFGRGGGGGRGRRPFAEYADINLHGAVDGIVAVPSNPPPLEVSIREVAPTLAWVGIALLGAGAAIMAFVIFRPTRARLRSLEDAARALGEGRTGVRANEAGGDEVSARGRSTPWPTTARAPGALAESDRARRQLLADVSFELMTPPRRSRLRRNAGDAGAGAGRATRQRYSRGGRRDPQARGDHRRPLDLARLEGGGETLDASRC
jgi:hypothetical protein